jgi:hypothetical protein
LCLLINSLALAKRSWDLPAALVLRSSKSLRSPKDITFVGVTDKHGNPVPDGPHHGSSAGRNFHNKLIKDLSKTSTKAEALSVIDKHHSKHMNLGAC